jgi:hypothetical protein
VLIARCAPALDTPNSLLKPALDDFARARQQHAEPAPGHTRLMILLLKTMADDLEPVLLTPAIDDLRQSLASQPSAG